MTQEAILRAIPWPLRFKVENYLRIKPETEINISENQNIYSYIMENDDSQKILIELRVNKYPRFEQFELNLLSERVKSKGIKAAFIYTLSKRISGYSYNNHFDYRVVVPENLKLFGFNDMEIEINLYNRMKIKSDGPDSLDLICFQCGSILTKKLARQGGFAGQEFYGCSTFPDCRYSTNLS